jgi:hypothetical protein
MGAQWMHGVDGNPVCDFAKANHLLEDVVQDLNIDDDLSFLGAPVLNFLLGILGLLAQNAQNLGI